jgi:GMP synthase (glutamine-hydrolysing)
MKVHFVVHESYEGPGAFDAWVDDRGYDVSFSRVHRWETVPPTAEGIDLLVVLGGPQSPSTTTGECPHFDSAAEQALIYDAISAGAMVVGVCLGAQLIGASLGADSEQSEEAGIGVYPIRLTADGAADARLAGFAPVLDVGHWHHDMPGLTAGAKVLASSGDCSRQIIKYGEFVYGFQCHPEFTRESVTALIENSAGELAASCGRPYVQDAAEILGHAFEPMNAALFSFLDLLTADHGTIPLQPSGHHAARSTSG